MIELYLMSWVIFSIEWLWSERPSSIEELYAQDYNDYLAITLFLPFTVLVIMLMIIDEKFERR